MTAADPGDATLASQAETPGASGEGPSGTRASATANEVVEHLLFHKALADHDPDRINAYIQLAQEDVASFRDPFDQAIALAFTLVLDEHLDPWSIDLLTFSRTYAERLEEETPFDLITSGRLLAMAWNVLLAQTEGVLAKAQPPDPEPEPEPWDMPWEDFPAEWGEIDEDPDVQYNDRVLHDPDPPITESVFHQGDRRVTLYELVEALEEARDEATRRRRLAKKRQEVKDARAEEGKENVKKIHKEDLEAEIAEARRRIAGLPGQVTISAIHDGTRDDFLTVFVASLFLHRAEMAEVSQEDFPFGPIMIEPLERIHDPEAPLVGLPKKGAIAAGVPDDEDTEVSDDDDAEPEQRARAA